MSDSNGSVKTQQRCYQQGDSVSMERHAMYLPDLGSLVLNSRDRFCHCRVKWKRTDEVKTELSFLCWFNFNLSYFLIQFIVGFHEHLCWHEQGDTWGLRINSKRRSRLLLPPPQSPFSNSAGLKCSWSYHVVLCPAVICFIGEKINLGYLLVLSLDSSRLLLLILNISLVYERAF